MMGKLLGIVLFLVGTIDAHRLAQYDYAEQCYFPFVYNNVIYYKCTEFVDGEGAKCNADPNADTDPSMAVCLSTDYCRSSDEGTGYVGSHQEDQHSVGDVCAAWMSIQGYTHTLFPDSADSQLGNYCRNPDGDENGPWCFTDADWGSCGLPSCDSLSGDFWCATEMGVTLGDSAFSASSVSSETDDTYLVQHARMDNDGTTGAKAWYPDVQSADEWIAISFGTLKKIWAVGVRGAPGMAEFVTQFKLSYTTRVSVWQQYMDPADPSQDMIFNGVADDTVPVGIRLDPPIRAYDVKFYPYDWTGTRIAMRVEATGCSDTDSCSSAPCQNAGECSNLPGTDQYTCVCPSDHTGQRCETAIDADCQTGPCQNGGTCTGAGGSYSCACQPGYDGSDCQTLIADYQSCPDLAKAGIFDNGKYLVNLYASLIVGGSDCAIKVDSGIQLDIDGHGYDYYYQENGSPCGPMCEADTTCTAYNLIEVTCYLYNVTDEYYHTIPAAVVNGLNVEVGIKECPGLVTVYCDFTDNVNPIGHLLPTQSKISVWGYEYMSRKIRVPYWPATETQIDAFYYYSQGCTQDLTFHCWGVTANYISFHMTNAEVVQLKSGDGACGCYLDGNCVEEGETVCSCLVDSNGSWRKDYGTVSNNEQKGLRFIGVGDMGHAGEEAVFEVGDIICQQTTLEIDECESNPCESGGTCEDGFYHYNCTCAEGYTGTHCETDINECVSDPCVNGATCIDQPNYYICQCVTGYDGDHCQNNIDDCVGSPCQNEASCVDGVASYSCLCRPGYVGAHCQLDYDECSDAPCENSAPCTEMVNDYTCACSVGYTGKNCETLADECDSNPCQNGATCMDEMAYYDCVCTDGYEGDHCETDTDDCAGTPCQYGGTCTDLVDDFSCDCNPGWKGKTCSQSINDCSPNPCKNGGKCTDLHMAFDCTCSSGWTGSFCDQIIDECLSDPCKNGAACEDKHDGYYCACKPGYMGTHCQTDVNECASMPCQNSGTCVNMVNGYRCICRHGFGGELCEHLTTDGGFGEWGLWGQCNRKCGEGLNSRRRYCDSPAPENGGLDCQGPVSEARTCTGMDCTNADGNWGMWGSWSSCSATCGTGEKTRTKRCDNPRRAGTGVPCEGSDTETAHCQYFKCGLAVGGSWGTWGEFEECTADCGYGTARRWRVCDNPPPAYGGADCSGDAQGPKPCKVRVCPVYSNWGEWEEWGTSSSTCGDGMRTRRRLGHRQSLALPVGGGGDGAAASAVEYPAEKYEYNHEHHEDLPCGGSEEEEIMSCWTCESAYDGTVRSLECRGPEITCGEDKPLCRYRFIKQQGDFPPGIVKGCASLDECDPDKVTFCDDLILQIIDSITSDMENVSFPLIPLPDTVIQMYDALQAECSICCAAAGCNLGILPGLIYDDSSKPVASLVLLGVALISVFYSSRRD